MVLIAVHGSAARFLPAERGTVRLSLGLEDDDRAVALASVGALHRQHVADARSAVHAGTATWWGSDQVRVRSERRYLKDSETYRIVQVAGAEVRVKFQDFTALSDLVDSAGSAAGVTIDGIEWTVTAAHREQVQREVRVQAVQDATAKAEAYAAAIGGGTLRLQTLWEPGLRPGAGDGEQGGVMLRAMTGMGGGGGFELRPDDIEIAAAITADFLLDPPS